MKTTEYTVTEPQELLQFLTEKFPDTSRSKVKELLAHNVYVDGRRTSQFNFPLLKGMKVSIEKASFQDRLRPRDLDIVYEDQHLFVVNKHEGLLSNSKHPNDKTVITVLNQYLDASHQRCHAHIVHRLDRDTSGLMVVSKSKEVSQKFEEDWKGMVFDRRYVAVASLLAGRTQARYWPPQPDTCPPARPPAPRGSRSHVWLQGRPLSCQSPLPPRLPPLFHPSCYRSPPQVRDPHPFSFPQTHGTLTAVDPPRPLGITLWRGKAAASHRGETPWTIPTKRYPPNSYFLPTKYLPTPYQLLPPSELIGCL